MKSQTTMYYAKKLSLFCEKAESQIENLVNAYKQGDLYFVPLNPAKYPYRSCGDAIELLAMFDKAPENIMQRVNNPPARPNSGTLDKRQRFRLYPKRPQKRQYDGHRNVAFHHLHYLRLFRNHPPAELLPQRRSPNDD